MPSAAKSSIALLCALGLGGAASHAQVYPPVIELSKVNGANGSVINGETTLHWFGSSASAAGDVNGDGFDDLIIGATPFGNAIIDTIPGRAYVIFGTDAGLPAELDVSSLDGTNGFEVTGANIGDRFGLSVGAGDFNNDGFDDVIVGAPTAQPFGIDEAGRAHIILGHASPFEPMIQIDEDTIEEIGWTIQGFSAGMRAGNSVALADLNGDGFDDAIIGAPFGDPTGGPTNAGQVFVVYGPEPTPDDPPHNFDLADIDGDNGIRINGHRGGDQLGAAVASIGDFNADTFSDILIGAPFFNPSADLADAGAGYVIFGRDTPFPVVDFDVTLLNGSNGVRLDGVEAAAQAGSTVSAAGNLNNDSRQDVVIGARFSNPGGRASAGIAYVAFGNSNYPHPFALSGLDGTRGFIVHGAAAGDQLGTASASAGDFDNDGSDDLLVGAWAADPGGRDRAGTSYVIFGHDPPFTPNPLEVSTLNGTNGFALDGIDPDDRAGFALTGGFDIDGDSRDDLLICALQADPGGLADAGESYVIRGYTNLQAPVVTITEPADGIDVVFGTPVDFAAQVTDDEVGLAADLNWTSDVDGLLGTGAMITVPNLSPGFHTVTAAVDDSFFLSGEDMVQVSVSGGGCELDEVVTGPITGTETVAAVETITVQGDVRITATGNLTLRAGQSVTFAPGFSTASGGQLHVIMTPNPCP